MGRAGGAAVVAHNAIFDLGFLAALGFAPGVVHDTMLLSQLLHGTRRPKGFHGLAQAAERELGRTLDKAEQKGDWSAELTPGQLRYAAEDAAVLAPLYASLAAKIKTASLSRVAEIERRCLPAIAWLCRSGAASTARPGARWRRRRKRRPRSWPRRWEPSPRRAGSLLLGDGWNWDSPEQVKEAFAAVGVTLETTDDDALAAVNHPLAGLVREYRGASKLASTYGVGWYADALHDGRIYAGGSKSGPTPAAWLAKSRTSRTCPATFAIGAVSPHPRPRAGQSGLQPNRTAGRRQAHRRQGDVRRLRQGHGLAHRDGPAGAGRQDVTKAHRQLAKAVNFGLLYGMGAKGFRIYAQSNYGV